MESLESKIDRLSSEQRTEIEDFVDFLLSRSGPLSGHQAVISPPSPVKNVAPPPLTMIEPVHSMESPASRPQESLQQGVPLQIAEEPAVHPVIREIHEGPGDMVSHDYLAYGQFECQPSQPSPAT